MIVVDPPAPVTVIPVTGMICPLMVITSSPYTPLPSFAVALAVTVPLATAVTTPDVLIVAWPVPLVMLQVTVLFVAFVGNTVAVSASVPLSWVIVVDPPAPVIVMVSTGTD